MKKVLAVITLALALCMSANAQRESVKYASIGVTGRWLDKAFSDPGMGVAFGFRNYNQDAFVSFSYGAEAYGYWIPRYSGGSMAYGAYAIPEVGVAIGPRIFKWHPHAGVMLGYGFEGSGFTLGWKSGSSFDIGNHLTLDFSTYKPFNYNPWTIAANLLWRF